VDDVDLGGHPHDVLAHRGHAQLELPIAVVGGRTAGQRHSQQQGLKSQDFFMTGISGAFRRY